MSRTIIVSNRLPTKLRRVDEGLQFSPSEGGLATGLGSIYRQNDNLWIGWPGTFLSSEEEEQQVTEQLRADHMRPVFLTEDEIRDYYEGFSNETLWPTFHYFSQYAIYEQPLWEAYVAANRKFCAAVLAVAEPDDTIWIHDYQLLLLPQLLREALPNSTIGFFLHIPFPSYEIMRVLPWSKPLLEGMLGADLIGFHTYGYMRHFLSSVNRALGYPNQNGLIDAGGRTVLVDSVPMGIDYEKYATAAASEEARDIEQSYRQAIGQGVQVVLSIDRLDYTKGIPERLRAYDLLLERNPDLHGQVTLLMLVVPSRDQVEMYKKLKEEIDELVGRINSAYRTITWNPIQYFYRSFPFEELAALYRIADVALITPMRDGMNLVAKEFIASKVNKHGVLILSERAGAARELADALIINPTDTIVVAETLRQALTMPEAEQQQRLTSMQYIVHRYDVHNWVEVFMNRLAYSKNQQEAMATDTLGPGAQRQLISDYHTTQNRLLLLDYDGTLMGFNDDPQRVQPDDDLRQLLAALIADEHNRVVIISGRDRTTLQGWLGDLPLDFITEHGVWLRRQGHDWELIQPLRGEWKQDMRPILELYVNRTPGSFIEEKEFSLVWHYRKTDDELGELRARELVSHLSFLANGAGLQVLEGNKVIEIKNAGIDKGTAASRWLTEVNPDFVLAIGDDRTDEDTFRAMPDAAYTIKVGSRPRSLARFHLDSTKEVRELLHALAGEK